MKKMLAIAKKELKVLFRSPMAYLTLIVTLSAFHAFFFLIIDENREGTLRDVLQVMEFLFVFLIPLLTMKSFAEEKANGTIEFLMAMPVTNGMIVAGKFLGTFLFFTLLIGLTTVYYGILEYFGAPDRLAILSGYLGIWLEGAFFIAIGTLCSAWSRNQVAAAVSTYLILFFLYFCPAFLKYTSGPLEIFLQTLNTSQHLQNFSIGLLTTTDLIYYLSGIIFCLLLTRWSLAFQRL